MIFPSLFIAHLLLNLWSLQILLSSTIVHMCDKVPDMSQQADSACQASATNPQALACLYIVLRHAIGDGLFFDLIRSAMAACIRLRNRFSVTRSRLELIILFPTDPLR